MTMWTPNTTPRRRLVQGVVCAGSALVLLASCAMSDKEAPGGSAVALADLFSTQSSDYDYLSTGAELARVADLGVRGRIVKFTDGRVAPISEEDSRAAFTTLTMQVSVKTQVDGTTREEVIHVELDRDPGRTAADYDRAAPKDKDILLYLTDITGDRAAPVTVDPSLIWIDPSAGRPPGARIYVPISPQGFLVPEPGGVVQPLDSEVYTGTTLDVFLPSASVELPPPADR